MEGKILFLLLFSLLNCSENLPREEEFDIVQSIISYSHKWIGFTDCLKIRETINSIIDDILPTPPEFRGRRFLLLYNYERIKILQTYLQIRTEGEHLKNFLDLAEKYYEIFFKHSSFHSKILGLSAWDILRLIQSGNLYDCEDLVDEKAANNLVDSLRFHKKKLKLEIKGKGAQNILELVWRIMKDIKSPEPFLEKYAYHIASVKLIYDYLPFGLKEHGTEEELLAQVDECMDKFSTGSFEEEMAIFISHVILDKNYDNYSNALDFIRKKFSATSALLIASSEGPEDKGLLIKYERLRRIHSSFISKKVALEYFRSEYVKILCADLRDECWLLNFNEIAVITFYEICHSTCPDIFRDILPQI
jgi:hypothetical protein